jgi:adenylyltransferase/sulfurtransferase
MSELQRGLDAEGLERYSRHLFLEGVGGEGQAALRDASVLVVGAGGLGAPAVQYLAAAGIGTLAVADGDTVERSNLQRQVIHAESDVGRPKIESAREFVADLNPDVAFEGHGKLTPENARSLVSGYDFVLDAADNFPTRYLVNDACELEGVPRSFGAVHRFEGQVATFRPGGPCYRCVFPEAPPAGVAPDCATAGVLGVLPGTIGCLQATEAVKHVVGVGSLLDEELLVYDALGPSFERVPIARNPDCVCGGSLDGLAENYAGDCRV